MHIYINKYKYIYIYIFLYIPIYIYVHYMMLPGPDRVLSGDEELQQEAAAIFGAPPPLEYHIYAILYYSRY